MTEEEAKRKYCPLIAIGGMLVADKLSPEIAHQGLFCQGSACVMFQFTPDATKTLGNGMVVLVDDRDSDILSDGQWTWAGRYVKNKYGYLHRAIVRKHHGEIPPGFVIDHRDGNPLNNRLDNLRICEQRQNILNSRGRGGASQFKGVFKSKGRWAAQITTSGARKHLGTFDTEEEAAKAYDMAAKERADEFSRLNFKSPVSSGRTGHCGLIQGRNQ